MPHDTLWEITAPALVHNAVAAEPPLNIHTNGTCSCVREDNSSLGSYRRRQSQQSSLAKQAMATNSSQSGVRRWSNEVAPDDKQVDQLRNTLDQTLSPSTAAASNSHLVAHPQYNALSPDPKRLHVLPQARGSLAAAMNGTLPEVPRTMTASQANNDTPATTAPSSPRLMGNTSAPPSSAGSDTPSQKLPMPIP